MPAKITTLTLNPAIDRTAAIGNFRAGEVNRVEWEQSDPGGKGVNVASFLADFGWPVTVTGFLGQENLAFFQQFFARKDIENRFVSIAGSTRINIKVIDAVQDQVTDINFPGLTPSAADLDQLQQVIDQLAIECDWFVLSGNLPSSLPPDLYGQWVARLKAQGKTVVLDASGDSLRQAIPFAPDAIKPNRQELQEVLGQALTSEAAIAAAAQKLVQQGISTVVVSMGSSGALFAEAQETIIARPPQIQVVSTVGAGDAMVAGLITGKRRGWSLAECAQLATAFSIGTLGLVGPHLPPPEDVEAWMPKVTVQTISH